MNRYDAPDRSYGVAYVADELSTALMESMFHKHAWARSVNRHVALADVKQRIVRFVEMLQPVQLADITAPQYMAATLGLNLSQLVSRRYSHTQRLSKTIYDLTGMSFDGIYYPSRNNFPSMCVALFERSTSKVRVHADLRLDQHRDWPTFVNNFQIGIVP